MILYLLIEYTSPILLEIILLMLISNVMRNFFMDLIDPKEDRSILSIFSLSCPNQDMTIQFLVSNIIADFLVVSWYFAHDWIVNDIIVGVLIVCFLRKCKSNKPSSCLLILLALFIFSIFWEFMSLCIFKGKNIMLEVTTKMNLPDQLVYSNFENNGFECYLGLIDIMIPGVYINYVSRFGFYHKTESYYLVHMLAYLMSCLLCFKIICSGYGGQPILLYIMSALFLSTAVLGLCRNEIGELFKGVPSEVDTQRIASIASTRSYDKDK